MNKPLLPEVRGWPEWGPIFTDAALWRPVIEQVWAADPNLAAWTGSPQPRRIEPGFPGTCAVFIIDDRVVLKFFPPMAARDFDRERSAYRLIGGVSPHLPRLLAEGVFDDRIEWPYLALSRLPGQAWRDARAELSWEARCATLRELGRLMRVVHDTPVPESGSWPAAVDWARFVAARRPRVAADLRARTALPGWVIRELDELVAATDWLIERPRLLNADLTEDHFLVEQRGGRWRMTGLIDWADAEVGDVGYEWIALWFSICRQEARLFGAFIEGYDALQRLVEFRSERFMAFTALHRFGANMINEALTPAAQREAGSLRRLQQTLFPGLGG
jgi:hygromycin-B 7''-O-kinase